MRHIFENYTTYHILCSKISKKASNSELIPKGPKTHRLIAQLNLPILTSFINACSTLSNVFNFFQYHLFILYISLFNQNGNGYEQIFPNPNGLLQSRHISSSRSLYFYILIIIHITLYIF